MTEEKIKNNQTLYQCKECGFHYEDKDIAEKCEAWCREHKTCNVEITKHAEENKKASSEIREENSIPHSSELEICQKKQNEYLNNWKRERADFLNYKKDEMERFASFAGYAKEKIILEILPILDNLELAEKELPEKLKSGEEGTKEAQEWTRGFLQIRKQFSEFLKKEGIEEIEISGKPFDSNFMEIVEEAEGEKQGIVVEELQKGYTMNGKVIRPAKVKVAK